jgi:hypothetical protein
MEVSSWDEIMNTFSKTLSSMLIANMAWSLRLRVRVTKAKIRTQSCSGTYLSSPCAVTLL